MKNSIYFAVLAVFILILNLYPLYVLEKSPHKGRTYNIIHNNVQDYYFYQALMNEGANGNFLIYDPYTTETHQSSIIFSYFTLVGRLGKILNLPTNISYHLFRFASSILFFIAAGFFIKKLKLSYPAIAFLFFVFA